MNPPKSIQRCGAAAYTKLIDSRYRYNRYRYHKKAIINKDLSSLVGIILSLFFRPIIPFSFPEQSDLFIVQHSSGFASPPR